MLIAEYNTIHTLTHLAKMFGPERRIGERIVQESATLFLPAKVGHGMVQMVIVRQKVMQV